MNKVLLVVPLVAASMVFGCASQIMSGYVGKPVTAVIADYGMPSGAYDIEPGTRAFVWQMSNTVVVPGTTYTSGTVIGNQIFSNSYSAGGYASTSTCAYVMHAKRTRTDIEGPASWTVVGFDKPRIDCE